MFDFIEMVHVLRNIAADSTAERTSAYEGYVSTYDPTTNSVTVSIPALSNPNDPSNPFVTPLIPLSTPYIGNGFGLRYYPPSGTPCIVWIIERASGASIGAMCHNNTANPPNTSQFFQTELDVGELEITGPAGGSAGIKLAADGNLYLNGHASAAQATPIAVEGSETQGHVHTTNALIAAINTACAGVTGYVAIVPPIDTESAIDQIAAKQGVQTVRSLPAGES